MVQERKLSAKELPVFYNMERVSRKLVYMELCAGQDFTDVIKKYCDIIAFEKQIKNQWDKDLLSDMADCKFDGYIFSLYQKIKLKIESKHNKQGKRVKQVYPRAIRYRDRLKAQKTPSRNAEVFCQICKDYLQRKREFNRKLFNMMAQNMPVSDIILHLKGIYENKYACKDAKKFLNNTLNYIEHLFNSKQIVVPALIEIALDTRFINTPDIFDRQINIVCQTYNAYKDHTMATDVKKICYHFIETAFIDYEQADARLINFLFLGDWISVETSNLLCRAYKIIKERDLHFFVFETIKKLYNKIDFSQEKPLSESEKLLCTLYEIFQYK